MGARACVTSSTLVTHSLRRLLLAVLVGVLATFEAAVATTKTVPLSATVGQDSWIDAGLTTQNKGTDSKLHVRSSGPVRRSLVQFDLSSIPSCVTVTSADLQLTITSAAKSSRTIAAHRLTGSWVESSVTWLRANGTTWTTPGGDFNAAATATTASGTTTGVLHWTVTSDVAGFVTGTVANYGWLLKDGAEGAGGIEIQFVSGEGTPTTSTPQLVVTYNDCPTGPTNTPTTLPTNTNTAAPTSTPTPVPPTTTKTVTPTNTAPATSTPTAIPTGTKTATPINTPTGVPPTSTRTPTATNTLVATSTPTAVPPTSTKTVTPTNTVAPTNTPTAVPPTSTPTVAFTNTPAACANQSINGAGVRYVNVPNSASLSVTGNFSLVAWINVPNTQQQGIIEKYDSPAINGYALRLQSNGVLIGYTMDANSYTGLSGSTVLSTNAWHLTALTYDGANLRLYVDGALDKAGADTRNPGNGANSVKLGARGDDAQTRLQGLLAEPRIYGRALSDAEVQTLWVGGEPAAVNLISLWPLTEGSGTAVGDSMGVNAGTLQSSAGWSTNIPAQLCLSGAPSTPTATPTNTPTLPPTATATSIPTATATAVPTNTFTLAPTNTPTAAPTNTFTLVPTNSPSPVPTSTPTLVPTNTPTAVATSTATPLPTSTSTALPTNTSTPTDVPTQTPTAVPPTPTATAAPPTATPAGCVNNSVNAAGVRYVAVPDSSSASVAGNFSLVAWVNVTGTQQQSIIEKYDTPGVNGYALRLQSNGVLAGYTMDASTYTAVTGSTVLSVNAWHLTALTYDGVNLRLYVDGAMDKFAPDTRNPGNGVNSLKLGARGDDALMVLQGLLAEPRIYARALSSAEVQTMWAGGEPSASNLISMWPLTEGAGTSVSDSMGANGGTLQGSAGWSTDVPWQVCSAAPPATPTAAPSNTPTLKPTASATAVPTDTFTPVPTNTTAAPPTDTPTTAATGTFTSAPTNTPTTLPTNTATPPPTNTPTALPTNTATAAPSNTPTSAPTSTFTSPPTNTPTAVATSTPTSKPTNTTTLAPSATPTAVPSTPTATATATATPSAGLPTATATGGVVAPQLVGFIPGVGTARSAVADPSSGLVYVATDEFGLAIVDYVHFVATGDSNPPFTGSHVAVFGSLAVVASGSSGMKVVNIVDPTNPVPIATLSQANTSFNKVALTGRYAYALRQVAIPGNPTFSEIDVVDLVVPQTPVIVGHLTVAGTGALRVVGSVAYVASGSNLQIVDVSTPTAPALLSTTTISTGAAAIAVANNFIYVAGNTAVYVVDAHLPGSPSIVGTLPNTTATAAAVAGNLFYVLGSTSTNIQLKIIDVSTPSAPTLLSASEGYGSQSLDVAGTLAFLTSPTTGLYVIDVSSATNPTAVGNVEGGFPHTGIGTAGTLAAVAGGFSGLNVVDVSDQLNPVSAGILSQANTSFRKVAMAGSYAYALRQVSIPGNPSFSELDVVDCSHPQTPTIVGTLTVAGTSAIKVAGSVAYIAAGSTLQLVDVSLPTAPALIGAATISTGAADIAVANGYIYVAGNTAVYVVDAHLPSSPTIVGTLANTTATAAAIAGNHFYVLGSTSTNIQMKVLDVTNPNAPALLSAVEGFSSQGLDASGTLVFASSPATSHSSTTGGVYIWDASNPAAPVLLQHVITPGLTRALVAGGGNWVYAGDTASIVDAIAIVP